MKLLIKTFFITVLLTAAVAQAQQPAMSALETVETGVTLLLDTVQEARPLLSQDETLYYAEIEAVLTEIVDFDAVAMVVMSRYGSIATEGQIGRFGEILKSTLTRFYGSALASYGGEELVFVPSMNTPADPRADRVIGMELRGGNSDSIKIQYQMFLNGDNQWKLKNLSLGGINLGRQYYTQFAAAMTQYNNDIDQVLANW